MFFKRKSNGEAMVFPVEHFTNNLVFSKTHVWAYYELGVILQEFFSNNVKVEVANQIAGVFTAIVSDKVNPVECHIVSTTRPVNVDDWETQMLVSTANWNRKSGFYDYVDRMGQFIRDQNFVERKCFLGVCLGRRGEIDFGKLNVLETGVKEAGKVLSDAIKNVASVPLSVPSIEEVRSFMSREKEVYNNIYSSVLVGRRCDPDELLLLIKQQFYPVMPTPYLQVNHSSRLGVNDIISETNGIIKNNFRFLEITQDIDGHSFIGYRTCMTFTKFPKETFFPVQSLPFLYFPNMKGLPFTVWARFEIVPSAKMRKEIKKKKIAARNEIENFSNVASSTDIAINNADDISTNLSELREVEGLVKDDNTPWIKGSYYLVVEANSEDGLKYYTDYLRKEYKSRDIDLSVTVGDQYTLFMEQLVGANSYKKAVSHSTTLSHITTSGFNYSSRVGDRIKH